MRHRGAFTVDGIFLLVAIAVGVAIGGGATRWWYAGRLEKANHAIDLYKVAVDKQNAAIDAWKAAANAWNEARTRDLDLAHTQAETERKKALKTRSATPTSTNQCKAIEDLVNEELSR
jgi:hypothetical protein